MKKFFKNNYKLLIGIIIGVILSGVGVYAATILYNSHAVGFDNTCSGMIATNVQDALDELYEKAYADAPWLKQYKIWADAPTNYIFDGSNPPTSSSPYTPPTGKNVYAGLYYDGQYGVCIKRNGTQHCFRYNNWIAESKHVQEVFSGANDSCSINSNEVDCLASDFRCSVYSYGFVRCDDYGTNEYCYVLGDGTVYCT